MFYHGAHTRYITSFILFVVQRKALLAPMDKKLPMVVVPRKKVFAGEVVVIVIDS